MPKPHPLKGTWESRAAEVLSGRAAVEPGALIDLIHEINPTGRGRGAEETSARYALKSRLQSLLVARFSADLEVAPDADDPGVVSIRHRYRRHDACHAVIASLDDDARSWVQREIDLLGPASADGGTDDELTARSVAPPAGAADPDLDDLSAAELLVAGEEAREAYDYERAQVCFSRAVGASGGAVPAAVAFLSFAVDALAADGDALAVEARLPSATLSDPRVALLLAVAAARVGDEARALRHVARARDARAAEVLALLGRLALGGGDAERAARHLRAAEEHDPAHPDLRALADGIATARAAERAPREAALAALLIAHHDAEALAEAEAILARWPESEPARRAARQIEERQREEASRRHLDDAESAIARGEAAVALARLQHALAGPLAAPDREAALRRVREIEAAERARAAQAAVDHVVSLLAEAPGAERSLAAYAELPGEGRASVRARISLPALSFLDHIPEARPGGRVRAAVEAALALQRASSLVDKDPAAAAALVAAHDRLLDDVPLARSIEQRARAAAAEERTRRALGALREAEDAVVGDHLVRAHELLDHTDLRALPEAERPRAAALLARLAVADERRREVGRFERLRAAGSFAAARLAAAALAERDGGAERERWAAEAMAITELVKTRHGIKVDALSGGPELLQYPAWFRYYRASSAWVGDGGRELVLCATDNAWMLLRFVDLETGRVVRGVRVALDEPMIDPQVSVRADAVTVVGHSGVFELTTPGGELVRRFQRNWSSDRGPVFSHGIRPRGTQLLWADYGIDHELTRIVDIDGEPGGKSFTDVMGTLDVVGAAPPRVVAYKRWSDLEDKERSTVHFHEPGGALVGGLEARWEPTGVVAHPSGAGFVAISVDHNQDPAPELSYKVAVHEISARFDAVASRLIEPNAVGFPRAVPEMVCALDVGLIFVCFGVPAGGVFLVALQSPGPGLPLVELYRVAVPARITLAHDTSGRRAFALVDHPGGLAIAELGKEPPVLPESGPAHLLAALFEHVNWCSQDSTSNSSAISQHVVIRRCPAAERDAKIAAMEAACGGEAPALVTLYYALIGSDLLDRAAALLGRLQASHPEDADVLRAPFALLVARRAWKELDEALAAAGPAGFVGPAEQHYHHLRATACAHSGDIDEARRHLAAAQALNGFHCYVRLTALRTALDSFTEPEGPPSDELSFDRPTSAQLYAVVRAADARLAAGDPAGAIAILERPLTWDLHEVVSLSRLATAYLALPCPSPEARFRRSIALACFIECVEGDEGGDRRESFAPGLCWTEDRIAALCASAVACMEAEQGVPRGPAWRKR